MSGEAFATVDKALDERTIGHNPERLALMKVPSNDRSLTILYSKKGFLVTSLSWPSESQQAGKVCPDHARRAASYIATP